MVDNKKIYYFAYGSNMDVQRLTNRDVKIIKRYDNVHIDHMEFTFNKISKKDNRYAFANVESKENSKVYGILYSLNSEDLAKIDKFEGYPNHYTRILYPVNFQDGTVIYAWLYIANQTWINNSPELMITEEYKQYIRNGLIDLPDYYREYITKKINLHKSF